MGGALDGGCLLLLLLLTESERSSSSDRRAREQIKMRERDEARAERASKRKK